jgi:hypothetical protein
MGKHSTTTLARAHSRYGILGLRMGARYSFKDGKLARDPLVVGKWCIPTWILGIQLS